VTTLMGSRGGRRTCPPTHGNTQPEHAAWIRRTGHSHGTWPGTPVPLPERLRAILPAGTAETWETIAPAVPPDAYLGDGTAVAVHLAHRMSRDLDFFFHHDSVDLDRLAKRLSALGAFAVSQRAPGTLNGVFSGTRVQFLHADERRPQHLLETPQQVEGLRIAQISDLLAMKLKVVGDRAELRDYFDLMVIEQRAGRMAEEGLSLFLDRYQPEYPDQALNHIVLGLGYFDDLDPDEALPVPRQEVVDYWSRRQPEIVIARGR
jgi:Nucleotidyl transferase AbiEii toxin, Type IV TA system